jgi:hypothetical protein
MWWKQKKTYMFTSLFMLLSDFLGFTCQKSVNKNFANSIIISFYSSMKLVDWDE